MPENPTWKSIFSGDNLEYAIFFLEELNRKGIKRNRNWNFLGPFEKWGTENGTRNGKLFQDHSKELERNSFPELVRGKGKELFPKILGTWALLKTANVARYRKAMKMIQFPNQIASWWSRDEKPRLLWLTHRRKRLPWCLGGHRWSWHNRVGRGSRWQHRRAYRHPEMRVR